MPLPASFDNRSYAMPISCSASRSPGLIDNTSSSKSIASADTARMEDPFIYYLREKYPKISEEALLKIYEDNGFNLESTINTYLKQFEGNTPQGTQEAPPNPPRQSDWLEGTAYAIEEKKKKKEETKKGETRTDKGGNKKKKKKKGGGQGEGHSDGSEGEIGEYFDGSEGAEGSDQETMGSINPEGLYKS